MAGKDITVRAQSLDGAWETLGTDRARGVWPENVQADADGWGSSRVSFALHRDPLAFWPDLGAFTPIELEVAGSLVWSGRITDTPSQISARQMNVQAEGWQYHLDDDVYRWLYVHTNLADWKDVRSHIDAPLGSAGTQYAQGWGVQSETGGIAITKPASFNPGSWTRAGVVFDAGPGNVIARVVARVDTSGNWSGSSTLYMQSADDAESAFTAGSAAKVNLSTAGALSDSVVSHTLATPRRFVVFFADSNATSTADEWVRFRALASYSSATYESGNASVLKASTIVGDALDRATVLLSDDRSGIQSTSFNIPSYVPEWQTPRQAWLAVNAYHDWQCMVDVDRRPVFRSKPSRPLFEVGPWSALADDDASMNSGQEVYSRAVVTAQSPDGQAVVASRRQSDQAGAATTESAATLVNPSFDVDASGWSVSAGTLARTTTAGEFDSGPGGGKWSAGISPAPTDTLTAVATGTFKRGVAYDLTVRLRTAYMMSLTFGTATDSVSTIVRIVSGAGFVSSPTMRWTPSADYSSGVTLKVTYWELPAAFTSLFIDSAAITNSAATIVDRRKFTRSMILPVSSTVPSSGSANSAIGDLWLGSHKTTPFRGTITLTGDESLRDILTGAPVPLEQLLLNVGQLIRFSDRVDPDTGGFGRDGRIAGVSYSPATNTAQVTIDSSRTSFEALMSRLAVVQGG